MISPMEGYSFHPNPNEIFSYFLPMRLMGVPVLPPPFEALVGEIDLYGNTSPDELFQRDFQDEDEEDDKEGKNVYFFTNLKPKNSKLSCKRYIRSAGQGTWEGERPYPCSMFNEEGEKVEVGKKRLFRFKFGNNNGKKDDNGNYMDKNGYTWHMHEYSMEMNYVMFLLEKYNIIDPSTTSYFDAAQSYYKNIVFCHVYKKLVEKKRKVEEENSEMIKSKKIRNNYDDQGSVIRANNYNHQETIMNGLDLTATTMAALETPHQHHHGLESLMLMNTLDFDVKQQTSDFSFLEKILLPDDINDEQELLESSVVDNDADKQGLSFQELLMSDDNQIEFQDFNDDDGDDQIELHNCSLEDFGQDLERVLISNDDDDQDLQNSSLEEFILDVERELLDDDDDDGMPMI